MNEYDDTRGMKGVSVVTSVPLAVTGIWISQSHFFFLHSGRNPAPDAHESRICRSFSMIYSFVYSLFAGTLFLLIFTVIFSGEPLLVKSPPQLPPMYTPLSPRYSNPITLCTQALPGYPLPWLSNSSSPSTPAIAQHCRAEVAAWAQVAVDIVFFSITNYLPLPQAP